MAAYTAMANLTSCKPQVACFRSTCPSQARQAQRPAAAGSPVKHDHSSYSDRRHVLLSSVLGVAALCTPCEVSAIPLAPLGKSTDKVGGDKLQMPSVAQVKVSANHIWQSLGIQPVLLIQFYTVEPSLCCRIF